MTGLFHISLLAGTLHVNEVHVRFKIANIPATHSSLPADRFHTETCGHLAFTRYRCEILYWSEILTPTGLNSRRG